MNKYEDLIRREYQNPPALRVAKALQMDGVTSYSFLATSKGFLPAPIRSEIYQALRCIEGGKPYRYGNTDLWLYP